MIPIDVRDWSAHMPADAPTSCRNLLKRLRDASMDVAPVAELLQLVDRGLAAGEPREQFVALVDPAVPGAGHMAGVGQEER